MARVAVLCACLVGADSFRPIRTPAARAPLRPLPAAASSWPSPPHSGYHGGGVESGRFFEGWFLRITIDDDSSYSFIYHIMDPSEPDSPRRGCGAQILTPAGRLVKADPDALVGWTAASHELALSKSFPGGDGGEFFELTATRNRGRLQASDAAASDVTAVEYDFDIKPLMGWGGSRFERQYSTAGWLAALPIFEPGYQIIMSHGLASGSIVVDGKTVEFTDAPAYAEKNWGAKAFPSRWWWMQCNTFEGHANLTLTSTGALREIPLVGEEQVALIGVHWKGRFLPFPQVSWDVRWGRWLVRGTYNEWEVEIDGTCGDDDKGVEVLCPCDDGMRDVARETYAGSLRLKLYQRRGAGGTGPRVLVLDAETSSAVLEVGGVPWEGAAADGDDNGAPSWVGESEMTEPLKTIAFNIELEEWMSDRLGDLQQLPGVEIAGL